MLGFGFKLGKFFKKAVSVISSISWEANSGVTGGIGSAVSSWVAGNYTLSQGTGANQPSHVSAFTTGHGVLFDGSNDFLSTSNPLVGTTGSIAIVFRTGTIGTKQVLVAVTDTGVSNEWFEIGITTEGRIYLEKNSAGTVSRIVGSTFLSASTSYQLFATYDGVDYYLSLNGVEENPLVVESIGTLGWFCTVSSGETLSVGAALPSGSGARFFTGTLGVVRIWDTDITH
jgi:hypothetical protein